MILIVDDRPENIFALRSILELNEFKVDTAESGEEALKKVLNNDYSLIILDVQMPEMDGFEVAEIVRGYSKSKDTPIIFLSAISKEKKFITKGYAAGAIDYITKPVDPDILLMKVKSTYELSEQRMELKRIQNSLLHEIETRKKAESQLETTMEQLQMVMETLPQITFTASREGDIEFVNSAWYEYSSSVKDFPETHPDDASVCQDWKECLATGEEFIKTVRLVKPSDRSFRYYELHVMPVRRDQQIVKWVGAFTDIHNQKEQNEVLEKKVDERTRELTFKNRELEVSNNELQQFAWVISHDLKEPIRKIMTFADLIGNKYFNDNADARRDFERIISSADRMSTLIKDLLDFSRISVPARFEETPLDMIVDEVLYDFEDQMQRTGAKITKTELPSVEAVPSQMRQVFQNLVSNSLKFVEPGKKPQISITHDFVSDLTDAEPDSKGSYLRIRFEDNGIGFDEQYLDKIFMVFQRLNHDKSYEGTGIGLSIAKKSIEKHHGTITANSAPGKGTRFTIILPVKQDNHIE